MNGKKDGVQKSKLEILGERMRGVIEASGCKSSEAARQLGMTPSRLSNYLQGYREPDLETLSRFAVHYGVSLDYFNLAEIGNNNDDAKDSVRRYVEFLAEIDKEVNVEIVTDMGRRRFAVKSHLVSELIREHSRSRDSF